MEQSDNQRVEALLRGLSGWQLGHDSRGQELPDLIYKKVKCSTFEGGMALAHQVADACAGAGDHLGLSVYGFQGRTEVTIMLRTFREEETQAPFGVTEQDIALARDIETFLSRTA